MPTTTIRTAIAYVGRDVMVIENIINRHSSSSDPADYTDERCEPEVAMDAVALPDVQEGDERIAAAVEALRANGWKTVGNWYYGDGERYAAVERINEGN